MFRSIVNQGNDIETESWSLRFILFVWFGVCLVFSALYSGVLTAVLAVPSYETPIDSLSDLPRATKDGFTIGLLGGSSYEVLFKSAKDGLYKQTWDLMDHKDRSKSFVSGMDEGMKRVLERKFVFVAGEVFMSLYLRKYGYGRFYFGRERFFPGYVGFAFQMGSPITPVFTHFILTMQETGYFNKMIEKEFQKIPRDPSAKVEGEEKSFAIAITHLQACFYIYVIGMSAASMAWLLECITFFCNKKD